VILDIPFPALPAPDPTSNLVPEELLLIWKLQAGMVLTRREMLATNLAGAYSLVQWQCSEAVLENIRAQVDFAAIHQARDPIQILGIIRSVMYHYESRKLAILVLSGVFGPNLQTRHMSDSDYFDKFRIKLSVVESAGGTINVHFGMVNDELAAAGGPTRSTATDQ
jgi:hypothetical protein